jgi:hypothetical protein
MFRVALIIDTDVQCVLRAIFDHTLYDYYNLWIKFQYHFIFEYT